MTTHWTDEYTGRELKDELLRLRRKLRDGDLGPMTGWTRSRIEEIKRAFVVFGRTLDD